MRFLEVTSVVRTPALKQHRNLLARIPARAGFVFMALVAVLGLPAVSSAQTTVTLDSPGSELTDDTTIRGGAYASANYATDDILETKNSSNVSNARRSLLKFYTGAVPKGTPITKAVLTLTLQASGSASSRTIGVYWVNRSFLKNEANWYDYRSSSDWSSAGGDFGQRYTTFSVGTSAGSKVSVDVTSLVQQAVNGSLGTRYARIGLVDVSSANDDSYRAFFSSRASDSTKRPKLVITYGSSTTGSTTSSSSGSTLKVMQYNTHHGVGTDGKYDLNRIATVIANQRPDVVSLNEVMYHSSYGGGEDQAAHYKSLLESKTGQRWYYIYARMDGDWSSTNWAVGNVLLSRFAFSTTTRHALSYDRSVAQGTIVVNGRTVNLFSTHVDYDHSSYRSTQISQIKSWASTWAENRIIMGDFNTNPGTTDYNSMAGSYFDSWSSALSSGTASAPSGSKGYTHGSSRFDYVWESRGAGSAKLTKVWVPNTASSTGVKPSDHDPVVATFSIQ